MQGIDIQRELIDKISQLQLSENQLQIIYNLLSALIGVGGSMGVQWISKRRKSRKEEQDEHTSTIIKASGENVKVAQEVVSMIKNAMEDQRKSFEEQIADARQSCDEKIEELKKDYDDRIQAYDSRIIELTNELRISNDKILDLTNDKIELQKEVEILKKRLSAYENTFHSDESE